MGHKRTFGTCGLFSASHRQGEAVIGNPGLDAIIGAQLANAVFDHPCVHPHDCAPAMGEDGPVDALVFAPCKLSNDGRMPNERMVARPHHRSGYRCTIAYIWVDTAECRALVANS